MGLQYDSVSGDTTIEKRMTVDIVGTTESSSGITFGAKMRIRSNEGALAAGNGARVFLQTNGFELAMGNINGAIDSMPGIYNSEVGLTALADAGVVVNTVAHGFVFDGYSSNGVGAEGIEGIYTAGAFTGHVSYSEPTLSGGHMTNGEMATRLGLSGNPPLAEVMLVERDIRLAGEPLEPGSARQEARAAYRKAIEEGKRGALMEQERWVTEMLGRVAGM